MVDRSDLYPGAVVTAKSMVLRIEGDRVLLKAIDDNLPGQPFSAILSVEDRPLAVGEPVRKLFGGGLPGIIRSIHDGNAWVQWDSDPRDFSTELLSDLTRLPEPAPAEKAMRFKVGDRVVHRAHGRGEVDWIDYGDDVRPYRVRCVRRQVWARDADLSPAPAEERET